MALRSKCVKKNMSLHLAEDIHYLNVKLCSIFFLMNTDMMSISAWHLSERHFV